MMKSMNNNQIRNADAYTMKKRLMTKLREYDFAIVETTLFLDTHPNNRKALNYYTKLREERKNVLDDYEKRFGPITINGNMSVKSWDWVSGPWPWEGEC